MTIQRQTISTSAAPANTGINKGHFSQAMSVANGGKMVFIGGTLPIDPDADAVENSPKEQIERAYDNLRNVAEAAGGSLADIVFLMVITTDLSYLPIINDIQAKFMDEPHPPRSAMQVVALPHGVVELVATMML